MGARLPDLQTLWQAGIDPRTGLPLKFGGSKCVLKEDLKKFLRIKDEQSAVNRFVWKNLPANITGQELERMLYYKGQLCFFYDKDLEEYYFMPYALDGTIDFYGRYNTIHPVPMTSGTDDKGSKAQAQYLAEKKLRCIYKVDQIKAEEEVNGYTVLIHDYTKQLAQTIIPRVAVNDPLLDVMADCIPFMRTALLSSTGVKGVRVNDADQADSVKDGNRGLENGALTSQPFVPIIGNIEFQELTDGNVAKSEEFMLAMQSLDNLRLSGYGLGGGVWEKKAHELESEAENNQSPVGLIMEDGLQIRKNFCEIANKLFGLNIICEKAEAIQEAEAEAEEADLEDDNNVEVDEFDGGSENE